MFEPTTLPTAIPGAPDHAAESEVRSSGSDVPKPRNDRPHDRHRKAHAGGEGHSAPHECSPPPTGARAPRLS